MLWKIGSFHRAYSNDLKSWISSYFADFKGAEASGMGVSDSECAWGGLSHLPALHGKGSKAGGLTLLLLRAQRCCLTPSLQLLLDLERAEHILPLQDQLFKSSCSWTDLRERLCKALQRMMRERWNKILFKIKKLLKNASPPSQQASSGARAFDQGSVVVF